jgi:hypothetical protein
MILTLATGNVTDGNEMLQRRPRGVDAMFDSKSHIGKGRAVLQDDRQAVVAEFIRAKGVTRCPTACLVPTQGSVDQADRTALEEYALVRERLRQEQITGEEAINFEVLRGGLAGALGAT